MIFLLINLTLGLSFAQTQAPETAFDKTLTPAAVISKMMKHYAEAPSVAGESEWKQEARGTAISIRTRFQIQRPSRIYIYQESPTVGKRRWLVTSDGQEFSYPAETVDRVDLRLTERVILQNEILNCGQILIASRRGLGDPLNPFIELACASRTGLRVLTQQWIGFKDVGQGTVNGQAVRVITGAYKPDPLLQPTGTYTLAINSKFELVRYETKETIGVPAGQGQQNQSVEVTTSWTGSAEVDGKIDETLFKVVK